MTFPQLLMAGVVLAGCGAAAVIALAERPCGTCAGPTAQVAAAFPDQDEIVPLTDLPAAVRRTLEARCQGRTVREVERETEGGGTVYSITLADGDELKVALDGTLLGVEHDDEDDGEAKAAGDTGTSGR